MIKYRQLSHTEQPFYCSLGLLVIGGGVSVGDWEDLVNQLSKVLF